MSGIIAGAGVVVDLTATLVAQVIFTLFGILHLIQYGGSSSTTLGAVLSFILLTVFVIGYTSHNIMAFLQNDTRA